MANALYTKAKQAILDNTLDLNNGDIRALLVEAGYTPNLATDDNLDDIAAGNRVAAAVALANKSVTDGVFDADDVTFSALTGDAAVAVVLYLHTGTESTSKLLAIFDTAAGLPFTPNGSDLTIRWSNGADKILRLS